MATVTRMTEQEHKEIFQTISESIIAEPEEPKKKEEVDPRALRGALYLDEHHPGWAHKINLDRFNISDVEYCVVGQVAGYYDDFASKLFPVRYDGYDRDAEKFGILANGNAEELNRSWKILIKERQGGDA